VKFEFQSPMVLLALLPAVGLVLWIFFHYSRRNRQKNRQSKFRSGYPGPTRSGSPDRDRPGSDRPGRSGTDVSGRRASRRRSAASSPAGLILRVLAVVLLVLSLAGLEIRTPVRDTEVIFVSDLSDSTRSRQKEASEFIASSMKLLPERYRTGVVSFGKEALVEQAVGDPSAFHEFHSRPDTHYSNIDGALQRAESLFSTDGRKRIVVLTDGAENAGDGSMRANALGQQGIRVDGVFLDTMPSREVQLSALDLPSSLYQGESYDIQVEIDSTVETKGTLRLFADRASAGTRELQIKKGKNVFAFHGTAEKTGTVVYEAELEVPASGDTFRQNNRTASFVRVDGPPVVALVEGQPGEGRELVKIMEAGGLEYKLFTPYSLPNQLAELVKYDAVLLANVGYDDLGEKKAGTLDYYIKSMGKGLLVTGGDNSYALGGYLDTGLEKMLPVDMDLSKKKDIPSLAEILVIDKSGSMSEGSNGISKMDLAKEAAIRSLEALRKTDFIGVAGFDQAASWVVETQKAENREKIQDAIGTLQPGGGTNLYPGLNAALQSLKKTDAVLKHVIVLTDGYTEGRNYDGMVKEMTDAGITVSGVAVGEDSDQKLMEHIAKAGNGRYYFTDEFSSIPKIFTRETYLATRSYVNNETFIPEAVGNSPILSGMDALPSLDGYLSTTLKGGATPVLINGKEEDPVLACWDYGLGKVVAWTSDARGIWTEDWMKWDQASAFWLNALSSVLPGSAGENGKVDVRQAGDQGQISLTTDLQEENRTKGSSAGTKDGSGGGEAAATTGRDASAVVVSPKGKETRVRLKPSSPGSFQGNFDLEETGVYLVRVEQEQTGDASAAWETGLVYPYSPEYDLRASSSRNLLEHVVSRTGGKILHKPEDLLKSELPPAWKYHEVWPGMLCLAMLLFLLDITLRRLSGRFLTEKLLLPATRWMGKRMTFARAWCLWIRSRLSGTNKADGMGKDAVKNVMAGNEAERKAERGKAAGGNEAENKAGMKETNFTGTLLEASRKSKRHRVE